MKFKILVRNTVTQNEYWEEYDKGVEDPHKWAKETIEFFNRTLRPNEAPRELVEVSILKTGNASHHQWEKSNLVTHRPALGLPSYDTYQCLVCRITGRRYGLQEHIVRDRKYFHEAFEDCDKAIVRMKRHRTNRLRYR